MTFTSDAMEKVFSNDLLREKILGYVLLGPRVTTVHKRVKSDIGPCRLVNKSWLHTTSLCFRKARRAQFQLYLNYCDSKYIEKRLDGFIDYFTGPSIIEEQVPTFWISLGYEFWKEENYKRFVKFLTKCGSGLLRLHVSFPSDGGTMRFTFPHFSFPLLSEFHIHVAGSMWRPFGTETFGSNHNLTWLTQSVLNGSDIKCFNLRGPYTSQCDKYNILPYGMNYLILPPTITKFSVRDCVLKEAGDLGMLLRNDLPKLTTLELNFSFTGLTEETVSAMLEKFKDTLQNISFKRHIMDDRSLEHVYFRLPKLEKLKTLELRAVGCDFEPNLDNVAELTPNVTELTLKKLTVPMFHRWVERSQLESVTKLMMTLNKPEFSELEVHKRSINLNVERMSILNKCFPNLQKLRINFCAPDMSGLTYIFQNMTRLQALFVGLSDEEELLAPREDDEDEMCIPDFYTALFLGISEDLAKTLRTNSNSWTELEAEVDKCRPSSIQNMTELRHFEMTEWNRGFQMELPDALSELAFLKMPQFKTFGSGTFKVSPEMTEKWKETGRVLKISQDYSNFEASWNSASI